MNEEVADRTMYILQCFNYDNPTVQINKILRTD